MGLIIAIDESGDLGENGSEFFVMTAVISKRPRHLSKAYKAIPVGNGPEIKFYDSTHKERLNVLTEIAAADVQIVCVCIHKTKRDEPHRTGNELYRHTLEEVIRCAMEASSVRDIDILVDENGFIKSVELKEIGRSLSKSLGKNLKRCDKVSSNKCVRIADFIAGSIWAKYERENSEYFDIIKGKISLARESLRPR